MDTRTQDKIAKEKPIKDTSITEKVVPQSPQPAPYPPPQMTPKADVYQWRAHQPPELFVLTGEEEDDEPAEDVGGEIGKTPRLLTAWQITALLAGGVLVTAGVVGAIYWRAQLRPA